MMTTLDDLRRFTVSRNLVKPTTLKHALLRLGFVQADPIRSPARAQDLILRHRVKNYRAGDLERQYARLGIEEDYFLNYGYVTRSLQALMHPRSDCGVPAADTGRLSAARQDMRAQHLLEFVRKRGSVHPREVDEHFSHGKITNYWGGSSNASTHLLDAMHYQGVLRVARREKGIRIYAAHKHASGATGEAERLKRIDALIDVVVRIYAPVPGSSLSYFVRRLRYAVPQWREELTNALQRAKKRLSYARVEGVDWYWPTKEDVQFYERAARDGRAKKSLEDTVRLLAPFDPLVHDRARFELLWGWPYRFEAYTPVRKRKLGYYAMPLLWRDRVIGWGNLSVKNGQLLSNFGYVKSQPREGLFKQELEAELDRIRVFLGCDRDE